jgi:hypothetical protein
MEVEVVVIREAYQEGGKGTVGILYEFDRGIVARGGIAARCESGRRK